MAWSAFGHCGLFGVGGNWSAFLGGVVAAIGVGGVGEVGGVGKVGGVGGVCGVGGLVGVAVLTAVVGVARVAVLTAIVGLAGVARLTTVAGAIGKKHEFVTVNLYVNKSLCTAGSMNTRNVYFFCN